MQLVESASFLVNSGRGLQRRVVVIGICFEEFGINDLVRIGAADGECVADYGPLWFAEEAKRFAQIVDEAGQHEPSWMAVLPDRFGGLQRVNDLRQRQI